MRKTSTVRSWISVCALVVWLAPAVQGGQAASAAPAAGRPNIVFILADDLGYGSLNSYGADARLVRTPSIDRLAREGIRFTDANTPSSVCTPSRYALLTGRYCWRTPLTRGVLGIKSPLHIETSRPTLASFLKSAGYRTAAIGKWHLGYGVERADYAHSLMPGPLDIGFDYHFAVPQNHGDATGVYVENRAVFGLRSPKLEPFGETSYGTPFLGIDAPQRVDEKVTEVLTDRALEWLEQQDENTPFFLYFTPVAVHEPVTPSKDTKGASGAGPYGDWIHDLDRSVSRILTALDRLGFTDDTLVIFTSDNGGVLAKKGQRAEVLAYQAGLMVNGDWRGRKHSIYEGGFRVPFLVRWPGRSEPGSVRDDTINLVDMFATTAAILDKPLPPPEVAAEDSFNILPTFLGGEQPRRKSMILHSVDGNFAIRQGAWKFIEGKASPRARRVQRPQELVPQLYNLREDPAEQINLIADHPDLAARLADLLETQRATPHTRARH